MDGPPGRSSNYLILTLCEAPQALSGQNSGFASGIKSGMTMLSPMRHDTVVKYDRKEDYACIRILALAIYLPK